MLESYEAISKSMSLAVAYENDEQDAAKNQVVYQTVSATAEFTV